MSEIPKPEATIPQELQQPLQLTDAEAAMVLEQRSTLAEEPPRNEAGMPADQYVEGITSDGYFVTVYEKSPRNVRDLDSQFSVHAGNVAAITAGAPLEVQVLRGGSPDFTRYLDGGSAFLRAAAGVIYHPPTIPGDNTVYLPNIDGKVLFPIGDDGRPFDPRGGSPSSPLPNAVHGTEAVTPPISSGNAGQETVSFAGLEEAQAEWRRRSGGQG